MATRPIKVGDRIFDQQITLLDGGPGVRLYFSGGGSDGTHQSP